MALTVSVVEQGVFGNLRYCIADCSWDSSYPTGGEALLRSDLGFGVSIYGASNLSKYDSDGLVVVGYDDTNQKLVAYAPVNGQFLPEVTNTTDLSTKPVRVLFVGK